MAPRKRTTSSELEGGWPGFGQNAETPTKKKAYFRLIKSTPSAIPDVFGSIQPDRVRHLVGNLNKLKYQSKPGVLMDGRQDALARQRLASVVMVMLIDRRSSAPARVLVPCLKIKDHHLKNESDQRTIECNFSFPAL